jgi:ribosomal protection tetracycline resistance protein
LRTLNLGIVAHVDAGKTSLTERLLHATGVIDHLGSVDDGTTRTDTSDLERRRGITISSAVVSFVVGDTAVNLVDTPGHPDFIAEVERALGVLDGAVLVVSAVEGVQSQTRVLFRALRRLRIPTLIVVNKIDRRGARDAGLLRELTAALSPDVVALGTVTGLGTRAAAFLPGTAAVTEFLAERDDAVLAAFVDGRAVPDAGSRLAVLTGTSRAHPVLFGSAITGAGTDALLAALTTLLPTAGTDVGAPASGTVFKIERGPAGEKLAYVRMFAGAVRVRDRLPFGGTDDRVTGLEVFDGGPPVRADVLSAGRIGILRGLDHARIGDPVGVPPDRAGHRFAPPTLETVVVPHRAADRGPLHAALSRLAEQDPLIALRRDGDEIAVSLYGEVQKEVVAATLLGRDGLDVTFRATTTLCIERPVGSGAAVEFIDVEPNPFLATVGLRVEPAVAGSGVAYGIEVEPGSMPAAFFRAVEESVTDALRQGLHGWPVTDCTVRMTHCGYWPRQSHAHQKFDRSMSSTAGDFRNLVPLVLATALRRAGTCVHEPIHAFHLEIPPDTLGVVLPALAHCRAVPRAPVVRGGVCLLDGDVPAARMYALQQQVPALTRGEGLLETAFDRYCPVQGPVPERARSDHNPLDRREYLLHVSRRV